MQNKKQKWLIVGNWKMNPRSSKEAKQIFMPVKKLAQKLQSVETVICPPYLYMESLKISSNRISLGSQDLFPEAEGSFTGNVSYLQLKNASVRYAIIGHSERRKMGEDDELVNKKIKASLKAMITPIICVGESERDEKGEFLEVIKNQIQVALRGLPKTSIRDIVVAYEPVWAIGKDAKREATPKEVFEIVIFIKKIISDVYGAKSVPPTKILYGGSVDDKNARDFLMNAGVDGFLVGRTSLNPKKFCEVLKVASLIKR